MSHSKLLICSLFLHFTFLISFASSSYFNTTLTTSTTHQCSALLLFKQNLSSINDTSYDCQYPIMMNWNTSTDCCHWDGVTCDQSTGDVIGLDLNCGMLQGTLHPNTSLFNLPRLQRLNLASNDFTGSQIPREIGRLSSTLTHLNISSSSFSGQVPSGITLLHKMVSLDLSSNFDLSLEPHVFINLLQNYTSLEELSFQGVNISSILPAHLNISSSLKLLNLGLTGLHGKLPHYIFNLQSLENLDFSFNRLAGQIPWEISRLPKLVSLDLYWNDNLRMKPHIFNNLLQNSTLLKKLGLDKVNIGLVLPTYLNISSSLKSLDLYYTSLKGKLPGNIFNLQYLEVLDLGNNKLTGPLPRVNATIPLKDLSLSFTNLLLGEIRDSIGHFKSLTSLDLSGCSLTGPLPKSLFNLTNLTSLDLSYNNLSGDWELDTLLSSHTNLNSLSLSYSGLSITTSNATHHVYPDFYSLDLAACKLKVFPESLRSMGSLSKLDLSSNEIHGQIPHWAGEIGGSTLSSLNLSHNFITGLPQFQWYGLNELYLQSNRIQGPFPPSICNMSYLRILDLSNNRFDGVIPQCFGNITSSLRMINMGNNRFQGSIPNVYEKCGRLEGLILNGNQLEGDVPSSLSKCQYLKVLDMGNNHLNGTFPSWLGDLPNLQVLILKLNNFHGPIVPSSTVQFPFQTLQVLDLFHNRFVGQLPAKFFQNFNAMMNVVRTSTKPEYLSIAGEYYSIILGVKGRDQLFTKLFVHYTIVDLSSNTFEGEIPNIIGTLNSLKVLNLSHNNLNGRIPHTLGNLGDIESLDLSWNRLIGKIPQSLVDLKFLAYLNLSENHLMGRIPAGNQFNTFNENSFGGNSGLCGFPLHKQCEHGNFLQAEGDGDADEENGTTWKAVMLGYGCGTLLGLVMGYLMLSTGKPKWFNVIADKGEPLIQIRRNKKRRVYIGK